MSRELGNSALELLLFLPFALLALSAALDSGLGSIDAAELEDVIRYLPQRAAKTVSEYPLATLTDHTEPDYSALERLTDELAGHAIAESSHILTSSSVEVVAAFIPIDPERGLPEGEPQIVARTRSGSANSLSMGVDLSKVISESVRKNPSGYETQLTTVTGESFLSWGVAIGVSISGETRSMFPTLIRSQIGKRYTISRERVFSIQRLGR